MDDRRLPGYTSAFFMADDQSLPQRSSDRQLENHNPTSVDGLPYNAPEDRSQCSIDSDRILVKRWLAEKSARTQDEYAKDLEQFVEHVDLPLRYVTLGHLQDYRAHLAEKGYATSTQARKLSAIKSLFTFGTKLRYFAHNVGAALSIPNVRNDRAQRILSESELWAILRDETNLRNHVLLRMFYASGGRLSDLEDLRWRAVQERPDLEGPDAASGGQVTFHGKGGKTRTVALYQKVWQLIKALRSNEKEAGFGGDNNPVFRSQKGGGLSRTQMWRIVKAAAVRAGVKLTPKTDSNGFEVTDEDGETVYTSKVSPHWFRHAHASHALQKGADIELVRETLGHESIETTKTYLHAKPEKSSGYYVDDAPDFGGDVE